LEFLSPSAGIVFAEVLNIYMMKLKAREDQKGWVRLPNKTIQLQTCYSRKRVEILLGKIAGTGAMKMKRIGMPASRYIKMNPKRLQVLMDRAMRKRITKLDALFPVGNKSDHLDSSWEQNRGNKSGGNRSQLRAVGSDSNNGKRFRIRRVGGPPKNPSKKESLSLELKKAANRLRNAIYSVRKYKKLKHPTGCRTWPRDFQKLLNDGIPIKRFLHVLDWYCSFLKEHGDIITNPCFVPIAYTGKNFVQKFENLEAAMHREILQDGKRDREEGRPPRVDVEFIEEGEMDEDELFETFGF
jgi:hypothetical protein